jgi:hypothetical protein
MSKVLSGRERWAQAIEDLGLAGQPLTPEDWARVAAKAGYDPTAPMERPTVDVSTDPVVVEAAEAAAVVEAELQDALVEWRGAMAERAYAERVVLESRDEAARNRAWRKLEALRDVELAARESLDAVQLRVNRAREQHHRAMVQARLRTDPPRLAGVTAPPEEPVRRAPVAVVRR